MRRNLSWALGVLALLATAIFFTGLGHNVRAATRADATISGVVVNGTHDNAPLANQQVTLQDVSGDTPRDIALSTSDTKLRFSFEHIADTGSAILSGRDLPGRLLCQRAAPARADSIQRRGALRLRRDAQRRQPALQRRSFRDASANGLIGVANSSRSERSATAFVGTNPVDGRPMGLLRFLSQRGDDITLGKGSTAHRPRRSLPDSEPTRRSRRGRRSSHSSSICPTRERATPSR